MRLFTFLALSLLLSKHVHGQEACHFPAASIPRDEARLSALVGVREFRTEYTLPQFKPNTRLYAEVFQDGKLVQRVRLSFGIGDHSHPSTTGIISIGWRADSHTLVSVYDTGELPPVGTSVRLDGVEMFGASYFSVSLPEKHKSDSDPAQEFSWYPVMGLLSEPKLHWGSTANTGDFLRECQKVGATIAVVIYLYDGGGDPPLKFDR